MTFVETIRRTIASAALLLGGATLGHAQTSLTLTFEDVPTNTGGINNAFTANNGFTFFGFNVATSTSLGSGTNANSGTKFALGRVGGSSFYRTDAAFSFSSAWLSYRQFDLVNPIVTPVSITVFGFRAGATEPVFERLITLTNIATRFTFDFTNVEEVVFDTDALTFGGRTVALAMDDMAVSVVPEPASVVLMATGMLLMLVVIRRRPRQNT
jgi:hypothetical protein